MKTHKAKTGVAHAGHTTEVNTAIKGQQDDSRTQAIVENTALRGFSNRRYSATILSNEPGLRQSSSEVCIIHSAPWEEFSPGLCFRCITDRIGLALGFLDDAAQMFVPLSTAAEISGLPELAIILLEFNGMIRKQVGLGEPHVHLEDLFNAVLAIRYSLDYLR